MRRVVTWLYRLAVVAGAVVAGWLLWTHWPAQPTYRLGVRVTDPGALEVGAHVRRGGLTIGHVTDIDDEGGSAVVWLAIGERHAVAASARLDVATMPGGAAYVRVRQRLTSRDRAAPGSVLPGAPPDPPSGLTRAILDLQVTAAAARTASEAAARMLTDPAILIPIREAAAAAPRITAQVGELLERAGQLERRLASVLATAAPAGRHVAASAESVSRATSDVAAVTGRVRAFVEDARISAAAEQLAAAVGGAARTAQRARDWFERVDIGARSSTLYDLGRERVVTDLALLATIDGVRGELGWQTGSGGGLTARAGRRISGRLHLWTGALAGEPSIGVATTGDGLALDLRGLPDLTPRLTLRERVSRRWSAELRAEPDGIALGATSRW